MKKAIIIFVVLTIIGITIYFVLKNKKSKQNKSASSKMDASENTFDIKRSDGTSLKVYKDADGNLKQAAEYDKQGNLLKPVRGAATILVE